jgi:hypothetical protein
MAPTICGHDTNLHFFGFVVLGLPSLSSPGAEHRVSTSPHVLMEINKSTFSPSSPSESTTPATQTRYNNQNERHLCASTLSATM